MVSEMLDFVFLEFINLFESQIYMSPSLLFIFLCIVLHLDKVMEHSNRIDIFPSGVRLQCTIQREIFL